MKRDMDLSLDLLRAVLADLVRKELGL